MCCMSNYVTPPGWYPQNNNPNDFRWWDGNKWTVTVQEYNALQPQAQQQYLERHPQRPVDKIVKRMGLLTKLHWLSPLTITFPLIVLGGFITPAEFATGATGFLGIIIGSAFGVLLSALISTVVLFVSFFTLQANKTYANTKEYKTLKALTVTGGILIPLLVSWNILMLFYAGYFPGFYG